MIVAAQYSFNGGKSVVSENFGSLLVEVKSAIHAVKAETHLSKSRKKITQHDSLIYSPNSINKALACEFTNMGWKSVRVSYIPEAINQSTYREIDFGKDKLGIEVQFGKKPLAICSVAAIMTIFRNLGQIECGIEIVPVKSFAAQMSSGVSYFEQFVWDLSQRGVSNIDVPVLILGIDA